MTAIVDTIDTTTVSLAATAQITEAGGTVTYTASVDNAPASDMTVTLSNGETITIAAGTTSGTVDVAVAADEDAIAETDAISATIGFTYMMTDVWAIEVLAAYPFKHDIELLDGTKVGSTKHLPPTVSVQSSPVQLKLLVVWKKTLCTSQTSPSTNRTRNEQLARPATANHRGNSLDSGGKRNAAALVRA